VNDTLRRFDLSEVTQQQVNDWIGHGTRELLIQALAWAGNTTAETVRHADSFKLIASQAFGSFYQARCGTRSHLYPQVREVLQALREQGVKLVVLTNKEGRYTTRCWPHHALGPLFDRVISGDTLPVKKPDPAGMRAAWSSFRCRRAARCSWAIRPSTWPPRATPACRCGCCRMATTWASRSRLAPLTVSSPIFRRCWPSDVWPV
jgi:phosphoglycolate phosphatase-like HAD superfamily hydrolase